MQIGFIGLGKMGGNMVRRLTKAGHQCHIYSIDPAERAALAAETGAVAADSLAALVAGMEAPRTLWLMVPAGKITQGVIDDLVPLLAPGDSVVDGGNSYFKDSVARAQVLAKKGLSFIDCGTSGGLYGLERGYSLMIGGDDAAVARNAPIFASLAPGIALAPRTPARENGPIAPGEEGWLHCGPPGSGHYVKMIHNGIEYGMMQAFAEGFALFASASADTVPEQYRYRLDLAAIAEVWRRGSVVSSWLLDLGADALAENPDLSAYSPRVADSGEGRWTVIAGVEQGVSVPVIAASLFERFSSHDDAAIDARMLSALRAKFGGHKGVPAADSSKG
ncbi:MAG: decarboxylating 6-phosphogluconate dehydrogenase [Sphingomonadales bacterium]|nr:decarboxylating 6-phosphogluconate dehydrogenase [Sphingomonadales bacterium]